MSQHVRRNLSIRSLGGLGSSADALAGELGLMELARGGLLAEGVKR